LRSLAGFVPDFAVVAAGVAGLAGALAGVVFAGVVLADVVLAGVVLAGVTDFAGVVPPRLEVVTGGFAVDPLRAAGAAGFDPEEGARDGLDAGRDELDLAAGRAGLDGAALSNASSNSKKLIVGAIVGERAERVCAIRYERSRPIARTVAR
jgi:hypothetical protein